MQSKGKTVKNRQSRCRVLNQKNDLRPRSGKSTLRNELSERSKKSHRKVSKGKTVERGGE